MAERLAVIAGSGALVPELVTAAQDRGCALLLLTLAHRPDLRHLAPQRFSLAEPQGAVDAIRNFRATHFVLAGGVSLSDIARERLAGFFHGDRTASVGDSTLSTLAANLAEMTGAQPLGVHEVAPDLLTPAGLIAGPQPNAIVAATARHALVLARRAGALDLGQALVVAGRRTIAAEDIAGTDALLARVRRFRIMGLAADGRSPLVLAKAAKPAQPHFVDLPAIGPVTIARARRAGIVAIVMQAGATLLIQRQKLKAAADAAGISILGHPADDD